MTRAAPALEELKISDIQDEEIKKSKQELAESRQKMRLIEQIYDKSAMAKSAIERIPSGIKGLDPLIGGGFEKGSTILLSGGAGTGKTTFAMQFLYHGAKDYGDPGLMISFEETRESLYRHMHSYGWNFFELEKKGLFKVLEFRPHQVEKIMEEGGGPIKDTIDSMGVKRLVIDSITSYAILFKDEYVRRENLLKLFELLHKWQCTSIVISESVPLISATKEDLLAFLTDAVIVMYYELEPKRGVRVHTCEILKMRGTKHANNMLAVKFEKHGIAIYPHVDVFF
jgi:circadian clock protein KaiC